MSMWMGVGWEWFMSPQGTKPCWLFVVWGSSSGGAIIALKGNPSELFQAHS